MWMFCPQYEKMREEKSHGNVKMENDDLAKNMIL